VFSVLKCITAASCYAIGSSSGSRWHSITITSLPSYPLPLFRLHPIVNWQTLSAPVPSALAPCNLSSSLIHVGPSSSCASTLPLTLRLSSSSLPSFTPDVSITPVCYYSTSSNVSIACVFDQQQRTFFSTVPCGDAAVISGVTGIKVTCKAVQVASSGASLAFSSTGALSFLFPSPPVDFGLECLRLPHASFSWTLPASSPPRYVSVLISGGAVIGQQQIEPSLPYESASVTWLLPAAASWVASCVASVYRSDVCINPRSSAASSGGNATETDFVFTSCPDFPRIDLKAIELFLPPEDDELGDSAVKEAACYSQWVCSCVGADVAAPTALGVISNGTHGAIAVAPDASNQAAGRFSVRSTACCTPLPPSPSPSVLPQVFLRAADGRLPFFKTDTG
jgi:hypothetical protein